MNWHRFDEHYDISRPTPLQCDLIFICNQIIHSYVFIATFGGLGRLNGMMFTSDRLRHTRLHEIGLERVIELFREVGNDYPSSGTWKFNPGRKDYDVVQGHDEIPTVEQKVFAATVSETGLSDVIST
jgi:hypothetical protein